MTTVGYGDKSPKSPPGRLFAMLWILIGLTVVSIYIAVLTTEIMNRGPLSQEGNDLDDLTGSRVGVLKGGLGDMLMVNQHGGMLHECTSYLK